MALQILTLQPKKLKLATLKMPSMTLVMRRMTMMKPMVQVIGNQKLSATTAGGLQGHWEPPRNIRMLPGPPRGPLL